jgi:membrane fusion protein, multidrug efflux system
MRRLTSIVLAALLAQATVGCAKKKAAAGPPPIPVVTAQATVQDVPLTIEAVGTVTAYNSVTVYARVTGQILKRHFKEGQEVKAGDLLFSVDPAPFQERLRAAEGNLARNQAALQFSESEARRYTGLVDSNAVSKSSAESASNAALVLKETIRAQQAEVEQARLNLSYCEVAAPIGGRTGTYLANEGAFVEPYKTSLVVVNQVRPIFVTFSIPETNLPELRKAAAAGALAVAATTPSTGESRTDGVLTFIDNAVDTSTGMIRLKAEFANQDDFLWPGQFVNVRIVLRTLKDVVAVPADAVVAGVKGNSVFVVAADGTVELRRVKVGGETGKLTVVQEGLKGGETVVTDGQNKLKPGAKVKVAAP